MCVCDVCDVCDVVAWGMEDKYLSAAEAGAGGCVRACVRACACVGLGGCACVRARASERVSVCGARTHVIDLLEVCECVCV